MLLAGEATALWFFIVVNLASGAGSAYGFPTKDECLVSRAKWLAQVTAAEWLVSPCASHPDG